MKTFTRITLLFAAIVLAAVGSSMAQRVISGTVYMEGEPAAGVTVEAHKGSSMMTSFDGKYKIEVDAKSKYIKFTFIDDSKKLDLVEGAGDVIDFAFTGKLPSGGDEDTGVEVSLKTSEELISEQNKEFMGELSLYDQFVRQDDYTSALPHWKNVYNKFPKSTINIYIHGAKIYEDLLAKAKTDAERDKILDDFMKMYDKRIKYFNQKGFVLGRKGTSWLEYKLDTAREVPIEGEKLTEVLRTGYEWLSASVAEQGKEAEIPTLVLLMQTSRSLFKLGQIKKEDVVKNFDAINGILTEVVKANKDPEAVKTANEIIPYIETLFGTSGAADCEALISIFEPQFNEKKDDVAFIKSMLQRLRKAKCEGGPLVEQATVRLYELEPSAEAAFNMARGYVKKDDIVNAKKYYQQAISQETDQKLLATYYYERAYLAYAKDNAYSEARDLARKALTNDPNLCEANMLIGDIYVAASRSFSGSNLEKAAIFWVAVDYYNKARSGDDCNVDAAGKASDYKRYFPNKEDAFMEGLQSGQKYKVEGWINETTTVRF